MVQAFRMRMLTPVEPRVRVEVVDVQAVTDNEAGRWRVTWLVTNPGPAPLTVESAWVPHGRFRGDGRIALGYLISEAEACRITATVSAHEVPGTALENAFLIVRAQAGGDRWQIFTRMTVQFDADAVPRPRIEAITLQAISGSVE
jgi:hypothetical protein